MKKIKFIIYIFLIQSVVAFGQTYKSESIAVFYFTASVDDLLGFTLDKSQNEDIYFTMTNALTDSAKIHFYPIDFLKGNVPYNLLDFPMAMKGKAVKSNKAKVYAKMDVQIKTAGISTTKSSEFSVSGIGKGKGTTKTKLKVVVSLTFFDLKGEKILDIESVKISTDKVEINREELKFGRLRLHSSVLNANSEETLDNLLFSAYLDLASKIK